MSAYKFLSAALIVGLSVSTLSGCASNLGSGDYSAGQTRSVEQVTMGVVTHVRMVNIQGSQNTPVGSLAGAAVGGLAGNTIGGGNGSIAGAILGAVLGGVAGSSLEQKVSSQKGEEITVQLDSGQIIAVTQAVDQQVYNVGDRVQVLSGNGVTRVSH